MRDQLLEFAKMVDRYLADGGLGGIGQLVPEGLEVVELGCQVGELGSGRFRRGNVLDATENVGERGEDAGQVGAELGWIRNGREVDLGHNGLWHGLEFFLLDYSRGFGDGLYLGGGLVAKEVVRQRSQE